MNYYTVLEFNLNDDPTNEVNTSCQIGDLIYYTTLDESGGFSTGGYINLGTVAKIKRRQVIGDNIMNIPGSTHDHENNKIIVDPITQIPLPYKAIGIKEWKLKES